MLKLAALVLPLCLDTFAVAAALGVAGIPSSRRLRVALLFMGFEGAMPLAGLLLGNVLRGAVGGLTEWLAIGLLVAVGGYLLLAGGDDGDEERARRLAGARGIALLGLGLSVSLDELAVGVVIGLVKVPVVPAVALIAIQAFAVALVGLRFGARVGERLRESAERAAGLALVLLGAGLAAAQLLGLRP